jgi:hypothetical protein
MLLGQEVKLNSDLHEANVLALTVVHTAILNGLQHSRVVWQSSGGNHAPLGIMEQ